MRNLKTIKNESIKAIIDTDNGAGLRALYVKKDDKWLEVMPDTTKKDAELDSCCFLMIPYSNRIKDGKFTFQGKTYQLSNAHKHAIHGDTRKRPWTIEEYRSDKVICSFNSFDFNDINWPWPFYAKVEYTLKENRLISRIIIQNQSNEEAPVGCGWHPYYNRNLTKPNEKVLLKMKVSGAYPDTDGDCIPAGPPEKLSEELDFGSEKEISPSKPFDMCCNGYKRRGYIHWPESEIKLSYRCSSNCSHLVLFNPEKHYFAVEPVTNANNGINLLDKKKYDSGISILSPQETFNAVFSMNFDFN